jgi:DNA polymerase delta subunit 1
MLHVTDFLHYLYIAAPVNFQRTDCEPYKVFLEQQVGQYAPAIHSVQMVMRENLYGFQGNVQNPYLKITVTDPKHIPKVRSRLEGKGPPNYKLMWNNAPEGIKTFDQLQFVLRFMVDCKVCYFLSTGGRDLTINRSLECPGWRHHQKPTK